MNCLLGLPLHTAVSRLTGEGIAVHTQELSCRKPQQGGSLRVVRQLALADGSALLTYARFCTEAGAGGRAAEDEDT